MRSPPALPARQRGVTAVIGAIVIVLLVGMIGFVVDLGMLYVRKTELQNAADAAALAGAKELNGTDTGIEEAVSKAIAMAFANRSDFNQAPVEITAANIAFADKPFPTAWLSASEAKKDSVYTKMWFIKVDTSQPAISQGTRDTTPFIRVFGPGSEQTTAHGFAVAGRTLCQNLPIFTCTPPDLADPSDACDSGKANSTCGYVKGRSYIFNDRSNVDTSPIGPGNIGWLDPAPFGTGKQLIGASELVDFLCRGRLMCLSAPASYTSKTDAAFLPTAQALNTRFGVFEGSLNKDDYKKGVFDKNGQQIAPACTVDTNVKEYRYQDPAGTGSPSDWLEIDPVAQSFAEAEALGGVGVSWSAVRPDAGTSNVVFFDEQNPGDRAYPQGGTPYTQSGGDYHEAPPTGLVTERNRRIITIGIASNCVDVIKGATKEVKIEAFGEFLMQRKAVGSGSKKGFYGEFIRLVPSPVIRPEIKLYR